MEFEEPEPIAASHLLSVQCRGRCGAMTLAVPEHLHDALCGPCLQTKIGQAAPGPAPVIGPVIARWRAEERSQEEVRERSQHPEPEVRGFWADLGAAGTEYLIPGPVLQLAELAREAGWEVRVSYARGNGVHGSTGRPTAVRHSIALAFGKHPMTDAQAVATYVKPVNGGTWSWESVWMWGPDLLHFGLCNLAELKEWLREGGAVGADWYAAVRERVTGVADAKAQRLQLRKEIKALHAAGESLARICQHAKGLAREDVLKIIAPPKAKKDHGD